MELVDVFIEMLDQYDLIHNTDWDTLILLDAARPDYFKKVNRLPGRFRKCRSRAHHTWLWLEETFPDFYDWTYFTAHPYVKPKVFRGQSYQACRHFKKIVPIWLTHWNDKLGTVHPDRVGEVVRDTPYERAIVHYIQPHGPWIGLPNRWLNPWTLRQHSKYRLMGDWVAIERKPDSKFFRRCYKDNLKLVLNSVTKYLPYFKGKVVITTDHAEMLGEKGLYLHGAREASRKHIPWPSWALDFLKQIFWFTLEQ